MMYIALLLNAHTKPGLFHRIEAIPLKKCLNVPLL